jgi:hypothetical protein
MQFLNKKIKKSFSCKICKDFQFFVIKTLDPDLDPDPQLEKKLDPVRIRIKSMRIRNPGRKSVQKKPFWAEFEMPLN